MLEPDLISRIRHIFLQPGPHVSIMQATRLLGWSRRQMSDAIESGDAEAAAAAMTEVIHNGLRRHEGTPVSSGAAPATSAAVESGEQS